MLATFRGRFDEAVRLIPQVAADGARAGLPDTERLVAALSGEVAFYQGPAAAPFTVDQLLALARRLPGHFMAANAAAWLMMLGQEDKAQAEMGRVLPTVLAGSGPRWLGAAAMLAFVAAIPALDLAAGGPGLAISDAEPLLDPASRETYRHRIRDLERELSTADRTGDSIAAGRADKERRALVSELRRATGLAGRPRRAAAEAERARVNVTRTIRAAIDRIMLAAPIAGAHLQSSIRTGTACRYQPPAGGPARWRT
jgi:hypothetical protein